MPGSLFTDAVLKLETREIPLGLLSQPSDGVLAFQVTAEETLWLRERTGQLGLVQTRRGVVLVRVRLLDVNVAAGTISARVMDRHRGQRAPPPPDR